MAERKAKMSAMNKTIQEAARPEREPMPKQEPTAEQEPMPEQPPAAQKKQKRELKKNSFDGSIDVADLTLDLAKLPQLVEELKSAMTAIDIPYSIDVKLSYLSKRLRHEHNLSRQGGISNKTLACLILDNALRNISYGEN
jgi:hypothetical protein